MERPVGFQGAPFRTKIHNLGFWLQVFVFYLSLCYAYKFSDLCDIMLGIFALLTLQGIVPDRCVNVTSTAFSDTYFQFYSGLVTIQWNPMKVEVKKFECWNSTK